MLFFFIPRILTYVNISIFFFCILIGSSVNFNEVENDFLKESRRKGRLKSFACWTRCESGYKGGGRKEGPVDQAACLSSQLWERGQIQRANQLTVITMPLLAARACVGSDKIPLIYYVHPVTACAPRAAATWRGKFIGDFRFRLLGPVPAGISIYPYEYYYYSLPLITVL